MKHKEQYQPVWASEHDVCQWLGITKQSLVHCRIQYDLAFTTFGGLAVMYDIRQINGILNENSSYQASGSVELQNDINDIRNKVIGAVVPDNRANTSSSGERAGKPARASRMTMAQRRRRCRINLTNAHMREVLANI